MIDNTKLNRINELAHKKKAKGLTKAEQAERKALHEEYIQAVRDSLRSQLDSIRFVDEEEDMTDEEKENVAFLTEKLGKEFKEQEKLNKTFEETLAGNPSNPSGEAGKAMLKRMNKSHKEEVDWGLNILSVNPKTILDVGCGGGAVINELSQKYPDSTIYGVDISDVAVIQSIETNRKAVTEDKVRISQAAAEDLPFGNNMFDLVISVNSYFFWQDFNQALNELCRVLKSDGTLMILGDLYKGVELSENEKTIDKNFNLKLLSPDELKAAFKSEDLKNIQVKTDANNHWICIIGKK